MTATLVFSRALAERMQDIASESLETAGVLVASVVTSADGDIRLLAREYVAVPDGDYTRREVDSLLIASTGYVPALGRAEAQRAMALWVHTHPGVGSPPRPSQHDVVVDRELSDVFRLRTGSPFYGALIISPTAEGFTFSGYVESADERIRIDRLWIVGDRLRLQFPFDEPVRGLSPIYDRNVRAFGSAVQHTLADLRFAVVGCGGTGSAVAEQLVRLGARDLLLIDPDSLSGSNVTRVFGSTPGLVGAPKVQVVRDHLLNIAPDAQIDALQSTITTESTARRMCSRDFVFGCTDDNAGRLVLSRLPTYLLCPVVDCGVLLSSKENGALTGIDGRVTIVMPGQACLVCRGRIDLQRASAELLTPHERLRLIDEGYAPALGRTEPAVVAYTTLVAATAVSELLERLIGYGPLPVPSEILLRCHEREISTNVASPRPRHYCHPSSEKIGMGMTEPFLEQTWA